MPDEVQEELDNDRLAMGLDMENEGGYFSLFSPVCAFCQRMTVAQWRKHECEAYNPNTAVKKIPPDIWNGKNDHTQPYDSDGGLTFKPFPNPETKGGE